MLETLSAALVLLVNGGEVRGPSLSATIHPWSTATFTISVNGTRVLRLTKSERIDLGPFLRRGSNTIDVHYRTDDGKISRTQPAVLKIETQQRDRKESLLVVTAWEDNPRGNVRANLVLP